MDLADRIAVYLRIEEERGRPLVVYVTSTRAGVVAQMAGDVVRELIDQIDVIPVEHKAVDVLIHSTGGDPLAAWKLMSVLRERFENVGVLVPSMAFSAATLFALGADEIVMHAHASLGPIDPQIQVRREDGSTKSFSFEEIGAFFRFLREEVHITEQPQVATLTASLLSTVDPLVVGGAKRASELATEVGERLLAMHMTGAADRQRAREIAENLNKSFFDHGDAVSRSRAKKLQLNVVEPNEALAALMWEAYVGFEEYMELRAPFHPLREFLADPMAAQSIRPQAPLNLPPNAPPQAVQGAWTTAVNNALQAAAQGGVEVGYEIVNAILESVRRASEFRTVGSLTAARVLGGEIQVTAVAKDARWRPASIPDDHTEPRAGAAAEEKAEPDDNQGGADE